jgi:hypothetical protein
MSEAGAASDIKDWLTSLAILVAGIWAIYRFWHSEWLRKRSEIPCLEGSSATPEILAISSDWSIASLRWTWRNAGCRPVYVDTERSRTDIYRLPPDVHGVIDPRQQEDELFEFLVASHQPLVGLAPYMFEPGTTSSLLTPVVLPSNQTYIARMELRADRGKHPTGDDGNYVWERWQVFRIEQRAS